MEPSHLLSLGLFLVACIGQSTSTQAKSAIEVSFPPRHNSRGAIIGDRFRWPNKQVIYNLDPNFNTDELYEIFKAFNMIQDATCIKFTQRSTQSDYVHIQRGQLNSNCWSYIGRLGGMQQLNLETPGCTNYGMIIHELLHAIGFVEETQRPDREEHVDINWDNVQEEFKDQLGYYGSELVDTLDVPYDYESIMHYGGFVFAVNPAIPTVVPKVTGSSIGQRERLSAGDILKLRSLDVDYHYSGTRDNTPLKSPVLALARRVVVLWKPPGSLAWVHKCATEIVYREKNPKFQTKLYVECEEADSAALQFKFNVHDVPLGGSEESLLGSVEVCLDAIIAGGTKGLDLPLFPLAPVNPAYMSTRAAAEPGKLYLRAERLKPINYAVLFKFGLRVKGGGCRAKFRRDSLDFFFEIFKLNEGSVFELPTPYTLIHRSELLAHGGSGEEECWNYFVLPVSRICNGEMGRVIKLEIFRTKRNSRPTGFALTTLRKMLVERELVIPVTKLNGKLSRKICLSVPLCYEVALHPFNHYLEKGLTLKRIYAVDYSNSNWGIHDVEEGRTAYEEAIVMTAGALIDLAQGDSSFYSFGNMPMEPYVANFGQENHIRSLLGEYREALYGAKLSFESEGRNKGTGTLLAPLLSSLIDLLSTRPSSFDYYAAFVFTDGRFLDIENSMRLLVELSKHPVSLVFVCVGLGDFGSLVEFEKEWNLGGIFPPRRIVHLIHFHSLFEWISAVETGNFRTPPADIYRKELQAALGEDVPSFMRIFRNASFN